MRVTTKELMKEIKRGNVEGVHTAAVAFSGSVVFLGIAILTATQLIFSDLATEATQLIFNNTVKIGWTFVAFGGVCAILFFLIGKCKIKKIEEKYS